MTRRWISIAIVSASVGLSLYYLAQGRTGAAVVLGVVAIVLGWLAFRPASQATTFRPVRTLAAGVAFFGVVTLLLVIGVAAAGPDDNVALGTVSAAVAAAFTGVMVWALVRARSMGYGWSSEVDRRRRPPT